MKKILDVDKLKQNINFQDEGFEEMMNLAGYNGKAFKENINNLVALQSMVKQAGIGTSTSQIVARRLSLGGVRSAANTFAIFGSGAIGAQQAGEGNILPGGVAGSIMLGLLTRRTANFLSEPGALKAYTKIVDPKTSDVVKRASLVNFLRGYFRQPVIREELPKEFNTPDKVAQNPSGFLDYLYNSEYLAVTDSINDGFMRDYMNERYGDNLNLSIQNIQNIETEEKALEDIETGRASVIESDTEIAMPDIPSMGGESMFDTNAAISGPGLRGMTRNSPLNADQRAALASGDLDAALALRGKI